MKSCHVALVVSALAMTASGVSIGSLPPSPTKASRDSRQYKSALEVQPNNSRRQALGPLARTHKRAEASRSLSRGEKTFSRGNIENQSPTFEEYIASFPHETKRNLRAKLANHPSSSKATTSVHGSALSGDIPGFVDIALPDQDAGVARTVSGLAYSMNSDSATGELELGTSSSHSTQFFMSPIKNGVGSSLYRLRVPVMDSTTLQSADHCATFPISPAGPLSLKKCGSMPGFSQTFSYDPASGELSPVYQEGPSPSLVAGGQNVLSHQINKRQFYRVSDCGPASHNLSKRARTTSSSQPSGILYFVPAEGVKSVESSPILKHSDQYNLLTPN